MSHLVRQFHDRGWWGWICGYSAQIWHTLICLKGSKLRAFCFFFGWIFASWHNQYELVLNMLFPRSSQGKSLFLFPSMSTDLQNHTASMTSRSNSSIAPALRHGRSSCHHRRHEEGHGEAWRAQELGLRRWEPHGVRRPSWRSGWAKHFIRFCGRDFCSSECGSWMISRCFEVTNRVEIWHGSTWSAVRRVGGSWWFSSPNVSQHDYVLFTMTMIYHEAFFTKFVQILLALNQPAW